MITLSHEGASINIAHNSNNTVADYVQTELVLNTFFVPDNVSYLVNGSPVSTSYIPQDGDTISWEAKSCAKAATTSVTLIVSGVTVFSGLAFDTDSTISDVLFSDFTNASGVLIPDNCRVTVQGSQVESAALDSTYLSDFTESLTISVEELSCAKAQ